MSFSLGQILLATVAYLTVLFMVGYAGDRGLIPRRVIRHPATYVLSLGVIAGGMGSNGVFALAEQYGQHMLLYYLGIGLMFLLSVLLLRPLLRLCRVHHLASLADVLTFRFRSPWVGAAVTLAMCLTLLPLLALQIRTVADSIQILSGSDPEQVAGTLRGDSLAFLFCLIISVFAILFGTRNAATPNHNPGLVAAIAFESLLKLLALLALAVLAVGEVFGGTSAMQAWLQARPDALPAATETLSAVAARTLLLLFFAGAVCMPHIFHMAFAENSDSRHLRAASWGLPLYLLLLALPVLPLFWAGIASGQTAPVEYTGIGLGIVLHSPLASGLAFMAGLSAASGVIIVTTLALANMCLNYLVLSNDLLRRFSEQSLYKQLKWMRRVLISALILGGYGFYTLLSGSQSLPQLAILAFSGTLQFFPAVVFTPYWPRANRTGLLAGLGAGLTIWFLTLTLPVLSDNTLGLSADDGNAWALRCLIALLANTAVFIAVSLLTPRSREEKVAAEICSMESRLRPYRRSLAVNSAGEFAARLAPALGEKTAHSEVARALRELRFDARESRPYALRHLRARIEANLSGMLGPAVALDIVDRCLPFASNYATAEDFTLLEHRLEKAQGRFTGLAADLDNLRRHYRQTLDELPVGLCSLGGDGEILLWNRAMVELTGISAERAVGSRWRALPRAWGEALEAVIAEEPGRVVNRELAGENGCARWVSLHCSHPMAGSADQLVLLEDVTDYQRLQDELLHNERLASIGRLAAGVAHEIGNPVTGIACLAQNLSYAEDPEEVRMAAEDIHRQTERISRIVESLVNFSHLGSGPGDLRSEACNLADCVDEAIHLLQLDRDARAVRFDNTCDREVLVLGDPQRLLQVFINVLGNARDASDEGASITISAERDRPNGQVVIHVDDCGHGVPPELLQRVVEPFFTTKDVGRGTGLGLPLVYSIIEDMGGSVRIDSPGPVASASGTRISLRLSEASYAAESAPDSAATLHSTG
jgi:PAS domain S-box-containing protein